MSSVTEIPASIDDVAFAGQQGAKHGNVVGGLASRSASWMIRYRPVAIAMPCRTALPLPPFTGIRCRRASGKPDDLARAIGRVIVDDDHFLREAERREINVADALEERADEALLVVGRDDNRARPSAYPSLRCR